MDHGDDGRGRVRRGDMGFEFPDAASEFLVLNGGIRFIDTGGFGARKVFGDGWVVGRDGTTGGRGGGPLGRHLGLDVVDGKQAATVGTGAAGNAGSDKRALKV